MLHSRSPRYSNDIKFQSGEYNSKLLRLGQTDECTGWKRLTEYAIVDIERTMMGIATIKSEFRLLVRTFPPGTSTTQSHARICSSQF